MGVNKCWRFDIDCYFVIVPGLNIQYVMQARMVGLNVEIACILCTIASRFRVCMWPVRTYSTLTHRSTAATLLGSWPATMHALS